MRKRTILFLPCKKVRRKVNHSPHVTYPLEYRLQMSSKFGHGCRKFETDY